MKIAELYLLLFIQLFTMEHQESSKYSTTTVNEDNPIPEKIGRKSPEKDNVVDDITFPSTLEAFGYRFNDQGKLVNIATNGPFNFNVKDNNPKYNQLHYESLGEVITSHVYDLLQSEVQLKKVPVPVDAANNEPESFIFVSDDALTNPSKLLVLVHGSGVVRAGQWARRLIINDCLDSGTQIPFIKRAKDEHYDVVVLNTNDNYRTVDSKPVAVRGNERPEFHIRYVWDHYLKNAKAKEIHFVVHSYGGVAFLDLAINRFNEIKSKVTAVAFTDSVHSFTRHRASPDVTAWMRKIGRNWVTSTEPLDTPLSSRDPDDVPCVSAGHIKHEMTSWSSFASIFEFLNSNTQPNTTVDEKEEL